MYILPVAPAVFSCLQLTFSISYGLSEDRFQTTSGTTCISSTRSCNGCQFCPPPGGELCPNACIPGAPVCSFCPHSIQPTLVPQLNLGPTNKPEQPTTKQFSFPTQQPVNYVSTSEPLLTPTFCPSLMPITSPTEQPSLNPTSHPQKQSSQPQIPTVSPSISPSFEPSCLPSLHPTTDPTVTLTTKPRGKPTQEPSTEPSMLPSLGPSIAPTTYQTTESHYTPFVVSTKSPSCMPSTKPTALPSISSQPAASALISNSSTILTDSVLITLIASIGAVITIVCGIILTRQLIFQANKEENDLQEGESSDKLSYQHPSESHKSFKLLSNPLQSISNFIEKKKSRNFLTSSQSKSIDISASAKAGFNDRLSLNVSEVSSKVSSSSSKSSKSFYILSCDSSIFHSGASSASVPRQRNGQVGNSINESQTRSVSSLFRSFNLNVGSTKSIFSRQYFTTASRSNLKQSSLITKSSDLNVTDSSGINLNLTGSCSDCNMLETISGRSNEFSVMSAGRAARTLSHRRRVEATFALNASESFRNQF